MFENFSYKQKFFGVLLGFVVLSMASYKKTFKHIIHAKKELSLVEEKLSFTDNSYNAIFNLKNDIATLDFLIGGQSSQPELVQQGILEFISNNTYPTKIMSIEDVHISYDNGFKIVTNQLEVEGTYKALIHVLYTFEKDFTDSRIVSTQLHSKKNYRTNTKNLYLKIIFQNYEKAN
jgi:hypothetical protein